MHGGGGGADLEAVTAGAGDVLAGKKIVNREGEPVTGTMHDNGNWGADVGMNGSVAVPEGHHGGAGRVNGPSVTLRGGWNARIGINGRVTVPEGYHNGAGYVDQAITNHGAVSASLGINGTYTIPEGYHNGAGKVAQSIKTHGGATIYPRSVAQTVSVSGMYMTGNITVGGFGKLYERLQTACSLKGYNGNTSVTYRLEKSNYNECILGVATDPFDVQEIIAANGNGITQKTVIWGTITARISGNSLEITGSKIVSKPNSLTCTAYSTKD